MPRDEMRATLANRTRNDIEKQFRSNKSTVIRRISKILRNTKQQSPGDGLKLDYSRSDCQSAMSVLYTETGIQGLLLASNYNSIDTVLLFVEALLDTFCGNTI